MPALPFLDSAIPNSAGVPFLESNPEWQVQINLKEDKANKNIANGYAGLDAGGKIALSQLPDANALESEAIAYAIALG